jgi:hypothetical protein
MNWSSHREELIRDIARLRAAEASTPGTDQLASVRRHLEELVGRTVPRATAARVLGVSQTALDRWIRLGDVPAVTTPRGRDEVPLAVLVDLFQAAQQRLTEAHPLASVLRERRAQAEALDTRGLVTRRGRTSHGHSRAELQGLAYHRAVGERLDERLVADARERLARWTAEGKIDPRYAEQWEFVLAQPLADIVKLIGDETESARDLRQSSPFAGALNDRERQRIVDAVSASSQ